MLTTGKVHKFGNNVNTDIHISSKYKPPGTGFQDLVDDVFKELAPDFRQRVECGDYLVAGDNFGIASSREDAVAVLKHVGIKGVIASSFGYLFFRNAVNRGLPVIKCKMPAEIKTGDILYVNFADGIIEVINKRLKVNFTPFPEIIQKIIGNEGLIPYIKRFGVNNL